MKNVLVTAIGTAASTTIVKELKKSHEYFIVGADMVNENQVATSLDVDAYYQFPPSVDESYIQYALDFCKTHAIDYYFAIIDNEVVNLTKNKQQFIEIGTKLCLPDYELARLCHYKELFAEWIEKNFQEIAIKQYKSIEEIRDKDFPVFIKPNEGAASRGCRKVDNYSALMSMVGERQIGHEVLIQEYIEGDLITVDCIRNRNTGQTLVIPRKEYLRNSDGCGIAVKIFYDEYLESICKKIVAKLDLNGIINIEFFKTTNGYKIVEVNPRHSAGSAYTCMAGGDLVINAIRIADCRPCVFEKVAFGSHFTKRYEAFKMN